MGNYLPSTPAERHAMLERLGLQSMDQLYRDLPKSLRLKHLDLPEGKSELELREELESLGEENRVYKKIFRGAGAYHHYIPAIVNQVTSKESFITAYTPYQAEISQGVLQSIFEYQTMICRITGLEMANASLYDGASALAEAITMCRARKKNRFLLAEAFHPMYLETVLTYFKHDDLQFEYIPLKDGHSDLDWLEAQTGDDIAAIAMPQLNFYGQIEDCARVAKFAHAIKAKMIMGVHPIAAALLPSAAECAADIAVGEGQPLGLPLSFGGPYLGFLACKGDLIRQIPGRIVGETTDKEGRRAFVLTLQAREQHIRREKAGSNICTNQALCALRASVYLAAMGPDGLEAAALHSYEKAHRFAKAISEIPGFEVLYGPEFFNEFVVISEKSSEEIENKLAKRGILSGLPLNTSYKQRLGLEHFSPEIEASEKTAMLWCLTEMNSDEQIDEVISILKEA